MNKVSLKKHWKKILFCTLGIILIIAGILTYLYIYNFHTVVPNLIYRSNQLSKTELSKVIQQYRIESVINLRGAYPEDLWYLDELEVSRKAAIKHYDVDLFSRSLPDPKVFSQLVKILDTAKRPLLIHCLGGADRSGLASTIVLILSDEHSWPVIEKQISVRYFVLHSDSIGKQIVSRYEVWLQNNHLTTSRKNFLKWVQVIKKKGWDDV